VKKYYLQIYRHTLPLGEEDGWIDVNTLEIHPELAERLSELGIIEVRQGYIRARQVRRVQKLMRLRRSLGVNLPGAAIILDLLERLETLEDEIEKLKRR